jgi:hypothetical protein
MSEQQNSVEEEKACLILTEQKLYQFSKSPAAQFSKQGLKGSSTGATLVCAFLMGAAEALESSDEALQLIIAELLGLEDRGITHLIDTTRRLSQKYPFVKFTLKQGRQAASSWQEEDAHIETTPLDRLLQKCQNLTLLELGKIEVEEEEPAPVSTRETVSQAVESNPRLKRLLFILLALIILTVANYLVLTVL